MTAERAEEIASLRGTKSVYQRCSKNIERELYELIKNLDINNDDAVTEILALKNSFSSKIGKIKELDEKILALLKQEEREKELESNLIWEDDVHRLFAKVERCFTKIKTSNSPVVSKHSPSDASPTRVQINLPKLDLPKFRGDIKQWQGFWDQFKASIHDNKSLPDIEKFNYLQTFIEESPKHLISGLSLTSENYKKAVNLLKDRYGNKQTLIFSYMDSFVQLPVVKNSNDVINLRRLYDKIEISVRNLDSLDVKKETYGNLLISIINARLPEDLRLYLSRKFENNLWEIEGLLNFLKTDLEAKERLFSNNKPLEDSGKFKNFAGKNFTSQALHTSGESQKTRDNKKRCPFCNFNNHPPSRCLKVTNSASRKTILRKNGLCFICFSGEHLASQCTSSYRCNKCKGKHHISICTFEETKNDTQPDKDSTATNLTTNRNTVLLQTAYAEVKNPNHSHKTNAHLLFDSGSQRSYISKTLREKLQLPTIRTEIFKIKVFGTEKFKSEKLDIVSLILVGNEKLVKIEAICYPMICPELKNQDTFCAVESYEHLKGLTLADNIRNENKNIDVLIGMDYYYDCILGTQIKGQPNEPIALSSIFGWVICGYYENSKSVNSNICHLLRINTEVCFSTNEINTANIYEKDSFDSFDEIKNEKLNKNELNEKNLVAKNLLKKEHVINENTEIKNEQLLFVENFSNSIGYHDKRYCVKLPFKEFKGTIPDNFLLAKNRLRQLKTRLDKTPDILKEYDKILRDYLSQGIIEKVSHSLEHKDTGTVHYLPHQAVIKNDRLTSKLRLVFDAASKTKNELSLNDTLHPGPCLLPLLYDILIRFRIGKYGLVADIKQAFLQICLNKEHRDFVRFLWFSDINDSNPDVILLRFARVLFGLTSSPFLLNATIKHHLQKYLQLADFREVILKLLLNLYVDDSTNTFNRVDEAIQFYEKSKIALSEASFDLRKWATNNPDIRNFINSEDQFNNSENNQRKVLGIIWDIQTDKFLFDFTEIINLCNTLLPTKRNILKVQGMFYDPLGLISPIILPIKLILQKLFELKLEWDNIIDTETNKLWTQYIKGLKSFSSVSCDRQVLCCERSYIQLHGFCDSSEKAYCAVVYARVVCSHGIKVNLWSGKSRVTSVKGHSIPRLELMSCVLLARLMSEVRKAIEKEVVVENESVFCWSDSMVSLWWIKQVQKTWKVWVQNRVEDIRKLVGSERWYYVPTNVNPADVATRVMSPRRFVESELWWKGPRFLKERKENWPVQEIEVESKKLLVDAEEKSTVTLVVVESGERIGEIMDCKRFGKLSKLLNVTSYVYRFVNNLKARLGKKGERVVGDLTLEEVQQSKLKWVQYEQALIKQERNIEKLKVSLNLFEDSDKIFRLKSRIAKNDEITFSSKFPILLRNGSYFTKLIIYDCHETVYHNGTEATLNRLRGEYWLIRGRQSVKRVLKECILCKYVNKKPAQPVATPELPDYRVQCNHAFEVVGADYAGPLFCKDIFSSNSNVHKCYILLFTCAFSRGVHLEITSDLTSESLLLALKRFISRRGKSTKFISDNAKTFKSTEVKNFLKQKNIKWNFILEKAPWWGGFYERLIGIVKSSLKKVLQKSLLTYEELYTVITEIESVMNSRPLTYLSEDEFQESLTPNHLIYGRDIVNDKCTSEIEEIKDAEQVREVRKHCLLVFNHFKKRFYNEYLNALQERHIYQQKTFKNKTNVLIGDVVLIKEDVRPRIMWKKGRIIDFIRGQDDEIRGVKLVTINSKFQKVELSRPLQLIVPLEIIDNKVNEVTVKNKNANQEEKVDGANMNNDTTVTRRRRVAALNADAIRKLTDN